MKHLPHANDSEENLAYAALLERQHWQNVENTTANAIAKAINGKG